MKFIRKETVYGWADSPFIKIVREFYLDEQTETLHVHETYFAKIHLQKITVHVNLGEEECKQDG